MRFTLVLGVLAFGCGGNNNPCTGAGCPPADMAMQPDMSLPAGPQLTVNNTLAWCDVSITVGSSPTVHCASACTSQSFAVTSGTTVTLHAEPLPTFFAAKWYNVTTMSGADATYVTTGAATQSVTACCPTSAAGAGCP